jgi:hypothetical protein
MGNKSTGAGRRRAPTDATIGTAASPETDARWLAAESTLHGLVGARGKRTRNDPAASAYGLTIGRWGPHDHRG